MRNTGVCKWFNPKKGYGFITRDDNNEDIFVHQTAIYANGFRSLNEGEKVEFEIENTTDKTVAVNVSGPNSSYVKGGRTYSRIPDIPTQKHLKTISRQHKTTLHLGRRESLTGIRLGADTNSLRVSGQETRFLDFPLMID